MAEGHYDVFLSHAGLQKQSFITDFVYDRLLESCPHLKVYLDESSLELDGIASDSLTNDAATNASLVVLVLSKEFFTGQWPIEEVELLLCWWKAGHTTSLLPVCYDMGPQELGACIVEYQRGAGDVRMQQWARELEALARITGACKDQDATGPQLVQTIVDQTVQKLVQLDALPRTSMQELPDFVVGLHSEELIGKLHQHGMVLLHGMAGSGKTTLAKVAFNQLHGADCAVPCHFMALDPRSDVAAKQAELLQELTRKSAAGPLQSTKAGRKQLAGWLEGKSVLLVLDNVTGQQLAELLPRDIMSLLGQGSKVLITSREATAAVGMEPADRTGSLTAAGAVRKPPPAVAVHCMPARLPAGDATQLFCWHAGISMTSPSDSEKALVAKVLEGCGRLAMAVEVVGRHVGRSSSRQELEDHVDELLPFVYASERAGRMDQHRTMFAAVRAGWEVLAPAEREALLHVVCFLQGQEWDLVKYCSGKCVLQRLKDLSFVDCCPKQQTCTVHPVIKAFCLAESGTPPAVSGDGWTISTTPELAQDGLGDESSWASMLMLEGMAQQPSDKVNNKLAGTQLKMVVLKEHYQALRRLRVSGLRWLAMGGAANPADGGMSPHNYNLPDMPQLTVVVLDDVQLEALSLGTCPLLRALHIRQCKHLKELPLSGITSLERLQVSMCSMLVAINLAGVSGLEVLQAERCESLRQVTGLPALRQLRRLSLTHCSRLAELVPSRRGSLKPHTALQTLSELQVLTVNECFKLERGSRNELRSLVRHSKTMQEAVLNGKDLINSEGKPQHGAGGNDRPSLTCKASASGKFANAFSLRHLLGARPHQ